MRNPFMLRSTHEAQCRALRQTIDEKHSESVRLGEDKATLTGKLFGMREHMEHVADNLDASRFNKQTAATYLRDAIRAVMGKSSGPMKS